MAGTLGPIRRRLLAEDLIRLRRSDDQRRYAASQRRGRIDPNPHQIDAVVFALRRIPEGGCILADEVGLGKTIEAGLIISQLMAEGKRRILLIVPKSLLGQWQNELHALCGLCGLTGPLDDPLHRGHLSGQANYRPTRRHHRSADAEPAEARAGSLEHPSDLLH